MTDDKKAGPAGRAEKGEAQSGYYQAIAREFLRRRGAPFFLSPRDLTQIAAWEDLGVPLETVLEGIGRTFDGIRDRSRGTKGLGLSSCRKHVDRAFGQYRDRKAGGCGAVSPRSDKRARAGKEIERFLGRLGPGDVELAALYRAALDALSMAGAGEETLERVDEAVDGILFERASREERDRARREAGGELPGRPAADTEAFVRTRLAKSARDRLKAPYASLFYY